MDPTFLLLLLVLLGGMMFLSFRRNKKALDERRAVQESLAPGVRVMTTAGLHATVVSVSDDRVELEIAPGIVTTWELMVVISIIDTEVADADAELDDAERQRDVDPHDPPAVDEKPENPHSGR